MKLKKIICSSVCTLSVLQSCAAARPQANGSILNVLKVTLPIFGIVTVGGVAWALWPEKKPPKENNPKNNGESPLCNTNLLQEEEDQNETPQQTPTQPPFNLGIPAAPEPILVIQPQNNNNNTTPEPVPEDFQNTQNIEPVQSAAAPTPADTQNEQTVVAPTTPQLTNTQNIEPIQSSANSQFLKRIQLQPKPVPKTKKITSKLQPTIVPQVQAVPSDDESAHPDINVSMPSFDFSKYAQNADDIDINALQDMLNDFRPNYEDCGLQRGDLVEKSLGKCTFVRELEWSDYKNTMRTCPKDMKFKNGVASPYISSKDVTEKISKATAILNKESSLLHIDSQDKGVMIVGDLHGNIDSLRRIFVHFLDMFDKDRVSHIVFLGDFTDRRFYGIENLTLLCYMKTLMPDRVHLIRGNHEDKSMDEQHYITALPEAKCKYPKEYENVQKAICDLYNSLPFAAVINDTALCLHGGITEDLKGAGGLEKINDIKRTNEGFDMGKDPIASGITWSEADYKAKEPGFKGSGRGTGYVYSSVDLKDCLENNGLKILFSGHVHETADHDLGDEYNHVTLLSSEKYRNSNDRCDVAVLNPDGTYYVEKVNSSGRAQKVNVKK